MRGALLCVACDLPAGKKVAGFLGHTAKLGCSKCLKVFPGGFGSTDYSGFDRSQWPPRTNHAHRLAEERTKNCPNKTQRQKLESEVGCRFSVLFLLALDSSDDLDWSGVVSSSILPDLHTWLFYKA